ncbi:MAG TPA: AraC family transcriptional regulator [Pyrinomonadaceae bacterium]|nr:AraC family transcriptional regulator [Pyrinomonadaceae bacterium]
MNALAQASFSSDTVFKRKANWDLIRLEHCMLNEGELPPHSHREHAILIALNDGAKGELVTATGGGMKGTQVKGSVGVLPAGLEHRVTIDSPCEHLALYLDPKLIARAASETGRSNFEIVEKYTRSDQLINNVGLALLGELYSEGLSGQLYAESLANVLAVHLLRYYTTAESQIGSFTGGLAGPKLRQVMNFIADNYANDVRLSELAQVAGMSSFHFAREFKRTTGTTPHQYLIKFRVERAKAFLADRELSLIEVSLRSGFSHQSHFTRLFHKLTGTTPHLYRLSLQD